jgi:uncharacterized protein YndB with AHSA1/START domain
MMTSRGTTPANELIVRLRRVLPGSLEGVYDALTNPAELARWWGPNGFTCPSVDFQPQVGSGYRIAMQPPEGELFHLTGVFREVSPPVRLAYTFVWEPPAPDDRETAARLSLKTERGGTELTLVHGSFMTEQRRRLHEDGWSESFDRLRHILA